MLVVRSHTGFSLVELLVSVAVLAMLLALGLPAMGEYLANTKVRALANNLVVSLQFARTEAIRQNGGVDLVLTTDVPSDAAAASPTASTTGPNWMVRSLGGTTSTYSLLEGRTAADGSQRAGGVSPVVLSSSLGGSATLAFNGLGATVPAGTSATFSFSNPSAGNCASASGPIRCLRVQVSPGGQIRLCDPAVAAATDPRHCN
jgi:type IV fimbrial biogenesis protein FimT